MKAGKYDHEMRSVRGVLSMLRLIGTGNSPLLRFRVGLEFAISGHREVEGMMAQHARLARSLAEQLGLPHLVRASIGTAYEQWDGRGWPGELRASGPGRAPRPRTGAPPRRGRRNRGPRWARWPG